jgi:hypothetical protein
MPGACHEVLGTCTRQHLNVEVLDHLISSRRAAFCSLGEVRVYDGFRVIARKRGTRVKLYSRAGNDLTYRFPLIVEALAALRSQSCIIDVEMTME